MAKRRRMITINNNGKLSRWGGARPGAGRKAVTEASPAVVQPQHPRGPIYSEEAVMAMIDYMKESSKKRQRTMDWNPYVIRPQLFGPAAQHLKRNVGKSRRLAMDDNTALTSANAFAVEQWMTGSMLDNSASEGMLFLGYSFLSELAQRPEYRLFGEIRAEEMTRNWIEFRGTDDSDEDDGDGDGEGEGEGDDKPQRNPDDEAATARRKATGGKPRSEDRNREIEDKIKELNDFADHLKLKQWFKDVAVHDSHFGIGHMYLDLKGADIDNMRDDENRMSIGNGRNETSKQKLGKGCLLGIRTIEPIWCYPTTYNAANPLNPSWYDPQVWYVMGAEVHKTRLLPFISRPVPDILKPAYAFGGLSMSQMAKPYVDIWLRTRESVGELIHAFSVMILSTNMGTLTQPGGAGGSADVIMRMMTANALRDNQGMMVIDKMTEDFKNISAPISGLDQLQAQAQEHLFSVGRIPAVKFTGIDPHGLNASSEGSLRAFGETIHGGQEQLFRTPLTQITDIMQISLWGERDPDITFDFLPLQELTMKEKAEIRKIEAETDQIRIDSGVVSQEEVRKKVVSDPESGYDGLDPDDVPDLLGEEEGGLIPEGAGKGLEAELDNDGGEGGPQADNDDEPAPPKKKKKGAEGRDSAAVPFSGGRDGFNEADHPRGQPGNAGQFGPGGAGGGSSMPDIPSFLKKNKGSEAAPGGAEKQKLKMPQFGLTPIPWESHQNWKGGFRLPARKPMPKSEGKPNAPGSTVAFTPGEDHGIKKLNGVAFKSWDAPDEIAEWAEVEGQADIGEPPLPDIPDGMGLSSGCVIKEPDGRVWIMRPKGGFGGYDQTFPKGGVEEGLSPQANAIKEVFEETGLQVRITGFAGDYEGDVTISRYYTAERVGGDPADAGWEAEGIVLAPADKLHGMLNRTRDRNIAASLAPPQAKPALKPGDLEKVGGQMGSNEGGVFKDKNTGEKFYVKRLKTKEHVKSEMAAARLYQLAGVNTLNYREVEGGNHVATELQTLDKKNISDLSPAERKAATADFGVHAWLSNWDAAGTGGDNQGVVGGKVTTLDVGGSLRYRAQGEPKGAAFGNKVGEIDTMRDPAKSHDAAKLFGKMSDADLTASAKRVTAIPDEAIRTAVGDDKALADTLIARKKDMAKRFGLMATDAFEENKHPRKSDGKFTAGAGGGGASGGKTWPQAVLDMLTAPAKGGSHYRSAISEAIKSAAKIGLADDEVKGLKQKLAESWAITMQHYVKKGDQKNADAIAAKIMKLGVSGELAKPKTAPVAVPINEPKKPADPDYQAAKAKANTFAAPKPQQFPAPTEAELAKAKKNVALQMQYVPGAKPELQGGEPMAVAQKIIEAFNSKYAGKEIHDQPGLIQKVNDFKGITIAINELAAKENAKKAEIQQQEQAKLDQQKKDAAEKLKKEQAASVAQNAAIMKELNISQSEADAFLALAAMTGGGDSKDLVAKFKKYEDEAKKYNYPITGFQYALLRNYINGGYDSVNEALRSGATSLQQHVYTKMVNNALDKLPKYTGTVERGTTLPSEVIAKYKPGHVVQHHAFTSTGVGYKFSGNVSYKIKSIGKRGGDMSTGANKGEKEVLFKSNTFFLVNKVTTQNGITHIEMEEVEGHG